MNLKGRYKTFGLSEGEFEPGSKNRVLKNLPGIKRKREMDIKEWEKLQLTMAGAIDIYDANHQFTTHDVIKLHKMWLGEIYSWAGQYRKVNISKDSFHFAAANQIEKLMTLFEKNQLKQYTPCVFTNLEQIVEALAVTHAELVLIHPFRDGNGRIARLLSTLMALQANLPPLDFNGVKGEKRQEYFKAVQSGMSHNYKPMMKIFSSVIKRTLKTCR